MIPTTERLARALERANAPRAMVTAARAGCYDDFRSESASPLTDLVRDLRAEGLFALAQPVADREFDATREEADAWAAEARTDPEMASMLDALGRALATSRRRERREP